MQEPQHLLAPTPHASWPKIKTPIEPKVPDLHFDGYIPALVTPTILLHRAFKIVSFYSWTPAAVPGPSATGSAACRQVGWNVAILVVFLAIRTSVTMLVGTPFWRSCSSCKSALKNKLPIMQVRKSENICKLKRNVPLTNNSLFIFITQYKWHLGITIFLRDNNGVSFPISST